MGARAPISRSLPLRLSSGGRPAKHTPTLGARHRRKLCGWDAHEISLSTWDTIVSSERLDVVAGDVPASPALSICGDENLLSPPLAPPGWLHFTSCKTEHHPCSGPER